MIDFLQYCGSEYVPSLIVGSGRQQILTNLFGYFILFKARQLSLISPKRWVVLRGSGEEAEILTESRRFLTSKEIAPIKDNNKQNVDITLSSTLY